MPLHFFGSKSTIRRFGERFRDSQYSLVSFLFALVLTAPSCPAICKSGANIPVVPYGVGATGHFNGIHHGNACKHVDYYSYSNRGGMEGRVGLLG